MTTPIRASATITGAAALAALAGGACHGARGAGAPAVVAPATVAAPVPTANAADVPPSASAAATPRDGPSPADVAFVRGMIAHHAQALAMTALVPARSRRDDMALLARRIEVSQRDEIALMRRWLADRGEPLPDESAVAPAAAHDMSAMPGMPSGPAGETMPGMLSAAQLDTLAAASGLAFERLFLADMIRHHEGALLMVSRLLGTPGGAQEPAVFQFASDVDADQRAEIARMRALLRALGAVTPRSASDSTHRR